MGHIPGALPPMGPSSPDEGSNVHRTYEMHLPDAGKISSSSNKEVGLNMLPELQGIAKGAELSVKIQALGLIAIYKQLQGG